MEAGRDSTMEGDEPGEVGEEAGRLVPLNLAVLHRSAAEVCQLQEESNERMKTESESRTQRTVIQLDRFVCGRSSFILRGFRP